MITRSTYRKKIISEPQFIVKYIDNYGQQHSFKSTKPMLESHKKLMSSNNQFIKSFSVEPIGIKE